MQGINRKAIVGNCFFTTINHEKFQQKILSRKLPIYNLIIFYLRLCIKPGIQEQGTECGERGKWGNVIFRGMSPNIPGNVLKHSGGCLQTFRGMSSNILGNVLKHSGECHQIFRGMSLNIRGMFSNNPENIRK